MCLKDLETGSAALTGDFSEMSSTVNQFKFKASIPVIFEPTEWS